MKKKVTIYDVAEAADVSLATVSRVINGSNVVKPATRERVLETIKRLDFKPNQIARGLATSKTTTIAVVFPQSLFGHVKDMIGGIGDTGRTLDFNIIMYTTDELGLGNPIEEVIEKVIKSRADGVVLFNNNCIDKEIDLIKKYRIPAVVVGYKISDEDICSVYVDAKSIAYDMTKQFIEQGKKNICFVRATQNLVDLNDFAKGIEEAFKDSGVTLPEDYIVDVSNHYEESYPQLKEYFDTHKHDVVLTGYDKEAVAVVNAAIDHGINVPEDMQVVGMMDTSYATICRPPLTAIHVPVYDTLRQPLGRLRHPLHVEFCTGQPLRAASQRYPVQKQHFRHHTNRRPCALERRFVRTGGRTLRDCRSGCGHSAAPALPES